MCLPHRHKDIKVEVQEGPPAVQSQVCWLSAVKETKHKKQYSYLINKIMLILQLTVADPADQTTNPTNNIPSGGD